MKLIKYFFVLCALTLGFVACDDDDDNKELPDGGSQVEKVGVAFGETGRTVLRNSSKVQIPIVLEKAAEAMVRVNVAPVVSDKDTVAEEGIDFNVSEKVINIPAGETTGYLEIDVLDPGKVTKDMTVDIEIKGVYGDGKKAETNQTFRLAITSNAFVEFEKAVWTTYESAATNEEYGATCRVPLKVSGELREAATVEIAVADSTAKEYEHFELVSKKITIQPGEETVYVELIPKDDKEVNYDRIFSLSLLSVDGSNLTIGQNNTVCEVTIVSEEKMKTLSFKEVTLTVNEGESQTLEVQLDYAPIEGEDPVVVVLAQKRGDVEMDENYTLSSKSLTFNVGEMRKSVTIEVKEDKEVIDRSFMLELQCSGKGVLVDAVRGVMDIKIKNNDYPSFSYSKYTSVEGTGNNSIPVNIPDALDHDVKLTIALVPKVGKVDVDYSLVSEEVTIPAGETSAQITFWIGISPEFIAPEFDLVVTKADGVAYDKEVKTNIRLEESNYRKFIGNYKVSYTPMSGDFKAGTATLKIAADPNHFGEYLICTSTDIANWPMTYRLKYNASAKSLAVVHKEVVFTGVNFTNYGMCNIKFEWVKDRNANIPVTISSDFKTLSWDIQGSTVEGILYKQSDDSRYSVRWFAFDSFVMTKTE